MESIPRENFNKWFRRDLSTSNPNYKTQSRNRFVKLFFYFFSLIVTLFILFVAGLIVTTLVTTKNVMQTLGTSNFASDYGLLLLNTIQIELFNWFYYYVCLYLTKYENHKYSIAFKYSFNLKLFGFTFINTFLRIIIVASQRILSGLFFQDSCISDD